MAVANLNGVRSTFGMGKSSVVLVDNFQSIRGGRTLDVSGYNASGALYPGHVIIKETSTGTHKPMPANGINAIATLAAPTAGSGYTNGTYTDIPLSGGSGTGASATITVAGGIVTVVTLVNKGIGYAVADSLTANLAPVGSGFAVAVATVSANGSYQALPASHTYAGILINEISTAKPFAGICVRGTINPNAAPFDFATIASAFKTAMPLIDQRAD